jgi:predicted patatin/cPLA2 family phospholipase
VSNQNLNNQSVESVGSWCTERSSFKLPFFIFLAITILTGCALVDRGIPVPEPLISKADIAGYKNIRYSIGETELELALEFETAIQSSTGNGSIVDLLAISGGGADGAFGAGLLCGWTLHGNRPDFQIVTGVSTGALSSPFAFLGSDYDDKLRQAYTTLHDSEVFLTRNVFGLLRGDSLATTGPLYETISNFIDQSVLVAIAREHAAGRRLFIMTTNLDAQRPVVWDMGAIATSGQPDALDLFRRVILASASIPIAFPPQYIGVEANGKTYTEMHVDGGIMGQVFLHLSPLDTTSASPGANVRAYIIRNSKVVGKYNPMTPLIIPILTRTLASLVSTQGVGDLYEIYEKTREGGAEYRLAYVPDEFEVDHHEMFEPEAMKKTFDKAFSMAVDGYPWLRKPPEVL